MIINKTHIQKWLPHIIGVVFIAILPIFVFNRENRLSTFWIYTYYYQLSIMLIGFYVNFLFIVPRFFFKKRRIYFFIILIVFAVLLLEISHYLSEWIDFSRFREEDFPRTFRRKPAGHGFLGIHPKLIDNLLLMILVMGFSTGMAILQRLRQNETEQQIIDKARVDNELAFLKNQISPHFFFNSLNNIYALIALNTEKAQDSVEKLSSLMRYLIYDSDVKTLELQKEFAFTENYIELMKQRLTSKVKIEIFIQKDPPAQQIPPLLFIPFIENTFKHGISYREPSFIQIELKTDNGQLLFKSKNSIPEKPKEYRYKGGLGIVNIKKRLHLLYGERADLAIENNGKTYSVDLKIPLNDSQ